MESPTLFQKKFGKLYKIIAVTAGVYLGFRYALPLLAPFVAAYFIAGIVRPVASFLYHRLRIPMSVGGTFGVLLLFCILGAGAFFLARLLVEQVMRIIENYGGYRDEVQEAAERLCCRVDGWFSLKSGTAGRLMDTGISRIGEMMSENVLPVLSRRSVAVFGAFVYGISGTIIAFVASVLLLSDREKYAERYRNSSVYSEIKQILDRLSAAGVAYLKTQGILMLLIGIVCTVGFLFIKKDYALLLGIGVAVLDAFPVLGSGLVLVPWAIISLLKANYFHLAVLAVMYLLCVLVREGLEPKLLGNKIGLPPLYTLMAVYVGVKLFGALGVILGPFGLVLIRAIVFNGCEEPG